MTSESNPEAKEQGAASPHGGVGRRRLLVATLGLATALRSGCTGNPAPWDSGPAANDTADSEKP